LHILNRGQAVEAPDELDVVRTPGRIRTHRTHVTLDRVGNRGVRKRKRQPHDAGRNLEILQTAEAFLAIHQGAQY
jgi:hypothetical protein